MDRKNASILAPNENPNGSQNDTIFDPQNRQIWRGETPKMDPTNESFLAHNENPKGPQNRTIFDSQNRQK